MNFGRLRTVVRNEVGRPVVLVAAVTNLAALLDLLCRTWGRSGLVVVLAPLAAQVLFWTVTAGIVALGVLSVVAVTKVRPLGAVVAVACTIGPACVWAQTRAFEIARASGASHREYVLLWQGSAVSWVWAIGEVQETQRLRSLVRGIAWDEGGGFCRLIRPSSGAPLHKLTMARDGTLLAVSEAGICWLAVNPDTGVVHDSTNLDELSPFLLLEENDEGLVGDVESLHAAIQASRDPNVGTADAVGGPSDATLRRELTSSNPWVRKTARALLGSR